MRHIGRAAIAWLPLIALLVLAGFAIGWWATGIGVAVLALGMIPVVRALREVRNNPPPDPEAIREELKELDRRAVPWIKAWTFGMLGFTVLFVVLLLVAAFSMRS